MSLVSILARFFLPDVCGDVSAYVVSLSLFEGSWQARGRAGSSRPLVPRCRSCRGRETHPVAVPTLHVMTHPALMRPSYRRLCPVIRAATLCRPPPSYLNLSCSFLSGLLHVGSLPAALLCGAGVPELKCQSGRVCPMPAALP